MSILHVCVRLYDGAPSWMDALPSVMGVSPFYADDVHIQAYDGV